MQQYSTRIQQNTKQNVEQNTSKASGNIPVFNNTFDILKSTFV